MLFVFRIVGIITFMFCAQVIAPFLDRVEIHPKANDLAKKEIAISVFMSLSLINVYSQLETIHNCVSPCSRYTRTHIRC